jgi:ribosomal protein S18 acetylase RimI-like enzyme
VSIHACLTLNCCMCSPSPPVSTACSSSNPAHASLSTPFNPASAFQPLPHVAPRRKHVQWKYHRESMILVATPRPSARMAPLPDAAVPSYAPRPIATPSPSAESDSNTCPENDHRPLRGPAVQGAAHEYAPCGHQSGPDSPSQALLSQEIAGSCIVLLKVLGAVLPPPFPSKLPARLYVGNLAVRRRFQRQGFGSEMLRAIETLGAPPTCTVCLV